MIPSVKATNALATKLCRSRWELVLSTLKLNKYDVHCDIFYCEDYKKTFIWVSTDDVVSRLDEDGNFDKMADSCDVEQRHHKSSRMTSVYIEP